MGDENKLSVFLVGVLALAQTSHVLFWSRGFQSSGIIFLQPSPLCKVDVLSVNVVLHSGCFYLVDVPAGTHDLVDPHVW